MNLSYRVVLQRKPADPSKEVRKNAFHRYTGRLFEMLPIRARFAGDVSLLTRHCLEVFLPFFASPEKTQQGTELSAKFPVSIAILFPKDSHKCRNAQGF